MELYQSVTVCDSLKAAGPICSATGGLRWHRWSGLRLAHYANARAMPPSRYKLTFRWPCEDLVSASGISLRANGFGPSSSGRDWPAPPSSPRSSRLLIWEAIFRGPDYLHLTVADHYWWSTTSGGHWNSFEPPKAWVKQRNAAQSCRIGKLLQGSGLGNFYRVMVSRRHRLRDVALRLARARPSRSPAAADDQIARTRRADPSVTYPRRRVHPWAGGVRCDRSSLVGVR
jgi:hypothetical protein